jgi:PASTA domain
MKSLQTGGFSWDPRVLPHLVASGKAAYMAAKKALKANSCTLGKVRGPRTGKVTRQKPDAGDQLAPGAKVNVWLA